MPIDESIKQWVRQRLYQTRGEKGQPNGYAPLDANAKVPSANLPSNGGGSFQFPIGAVYLNVTGVNPSTELGYGTWSQTAQGQMLVGQKSSDSDFDTAEKTGGEKTHTLTESEMPTHSHSAYITRSATTGSDTTQVARSRDTSSTKMNTPTESAGGGAAHNNLPPYFVVYIWKRTA